MITKIKTYLQNNQELSKVFQSVGWLFFDQIIRYGLALLIGVWMARSWGSDNFGVYNYAFAFYTIWGALAGLGMKQAFIRELEAPISRSQTCGDCFSYFIRGWGIGFFAFLAFGLSTSPCRCTCFSHGWFDEYRVCFSSLYGNCLEF